MPQLDFRQPRLFVEGPLGEGATVALDRDQANYLGNVMRLSSGASILAFNGRDGEWQAEITGRKRPESLTIVRRTREQDHPGAEAFHELARGVAFHDRIEFRLATRER